MSEVSPAAALAIGLLSAEREGRSQVVRGCIDPSSVPGLDDVESLVCNPGVPKNLIRDGYRRDRAKVPEIQEGIKDGWTLQVENADSTVLPLPDFVGNSRTSSAEIQFGSTFTTHRRSPEWDFLLTTTPWTPQQSK